MHRIVLAILTFWLCGLPTFVHAQSLVVLDCQGFTRAVQNSEPGANSKLQVKVSSGGTPANGAHVQVTNLANNQITNVIAEQGLATFENLPPGTYVLKVTEPDLVIETVSIGSMGVGVIAAGTALLGAGLGAGIAATGIVVGAEDLIDRMRGADGNDAALPTPAITPVPVVPTPQAPMATPTPCPVCDADAEAPSLEDENDFFAEPATALSPIE